MRGPWLDWHDGYAAARTRAEERGASLGSVLGRLRERTGPAFRADAAAGLLLLAEGPWLSWLPFAFLARLPELGLKPLPLTFGRRSYRAGLVARPAVENLAPVGLFEDLALERLG